VTAIRPPEPATLSHTVSSPPTAFDLEAFLEAERHAADAALDRALARWSALLPEAIAAAVAHGVRGGGKRLRPVLCVSAYRATRSHRARGDGGGAGASAPGDSSAVSSAVYDLAASLELVHAYSLMHDDLPCMDDAELRRGLPSTHRVHGEHATILAGAAMIPLAALQALESCVALGLDTARAADIVRELTHAAGAGGMVGGQVLDLRAEGSILDAPHLDGLHRLKTGALLRGALRMGGLAAGARPDELGSLDVFGQAVGLAFQITDDVLDATGTAEALGKNPSDAALRKSTYVSVHGLEAARRRAEGEVARARKALIGAGLGPERPEAAPLHALAGYSASRGH
jgi:geranylgeranyl pyrophosphate synthase